MTHQVAGSKPRPPQIHLFELCPPYPPIVQPRIVLLIPEWKGGPDATYSARFLYGSGSVGPDIYQPCQRSGEKDVVPLIIGCETPTDDSEEPTIDENELFLFLCKQRLFDRLSVRTSPIDSVIQQTSDNRYRYPDSVLDDSQLQPISSGWPTNTPTFEIQYDDWGREGTTWLDGTDFFAFNWGSSYGSRFILITKPECIGTAETTSEKIPGYSPFDPVYVCLLEFNNRLLDSGSENRHGDKVEGEGLGMEIALELNVGSGIVTTYPQGYTLLQGLDTKIETVMPFRLRVLKPANVGEWSDVILDRDHIVAASVRHFYSISPITSNRFKL